MDKLDQLLTEQVNQQTVTIDEMETTEMLQAINAEDQKVAVAVKLVISQIALAVEAIVVALGQGGRLIYIGAGTSGRLGVLDAAECPPTFGVDPKKVVALMAGGGKALVSSVEGAEDDVHQVVDQLQELGLSDKDVLVGIAASGRTPWVLAGLAYGNSLGVTTIAISCTPESRIAQVAQIGITPLVGPEVIAGSTRLKAGTATKLVLNMLTTGAMIKLGKVYGNLMVDLCPTNEKLVTRATRIIATAAHISEGRAAELLAASGGKPKVAIVSALTGCSLAEGQQRLAAAGGFVRKALQQGDEVNI